MTRLRALANDRLNYFTPTKKSTGYSTDSVGRRKLVYDITQTPFVCLLDSGILSPDHIAQLRAYKAGLDPVHIATEVDRIQ